MMNRTNPGEEGYTTGPNGSQYPVYHYNGSSGGGGMPSPNASMPVQDQRQSKPITVEELERIARGEVGQQHAVGGFHHGPPGGGYGVRPPPPNSYGDRQSLFGDSIFMRDMVPPPNYMPSQVPVGDPLMYGRGGHGSAYPPAPPSQPDYPRFAGNIRPDTIQRPHNHGRSNESMIADSIAALLQSDLRLSPADGTIVRNDAIVAPQATHSQMSHKMPQVRVPDMHSLPQTDVQLPRKHVVEIAGHDAMGQRRMISVEKLPAVFFKSKPDCWRLLCSNYDLNIDSILQMYMDWLKTSTHQRSTDDDEVLAKDSKKGDSDEEGAGDRKYVKQERENRWVDIMDHRHDGRKPLCSMGKLNDVLVSMAKDLSATPEDKLSWKKAFTYVEGMIKATLGKDVKVLLFGSAANGLSVRSSNDIDVSVECKIADGEEGDQEKSDLIEDLGEFFKSDGVEDILILSHARVPVIKMVYPETGTRVDITINNSLACLNTKLIADYCSIDARLAQLVSIVKHWAKQRNVNDPYKGTLSSYCYVLMCIFHLQTRSPPILPVLQDPSLPATVKAQVGEWKVEYFDDIEHLKQHGFISENHQSLAELVWEFFEFWAWLHDYPRDVVSVRLGHIISKESKDWTKRVGRDRHLLCVEDPFLLSHDLGRTVDMKSKDVMRKEFFRAATILRDFTYPEKMLFEPYTSREPRKYNNNQGDRRPR
jgi:predicted nucleotidyltransferase